MFVFSRKEQLGLIVLTALLIVVTAFRILLPSWRGESGHPEFGSRIDSFEQAANGLRDFQAKTAGTGGLRDSDRTVGNGLSPGSAGAVGPSGNSRQPVMVDINRADSTELRRIRGIGPVLSVRIVKYRYLLGGFVRKEQLGEVYGIDAERYARIESQFFIDTTAVRRIDLNRAGTYILKRHPYLDEKQAEAIADYRNRRGSISDRKELLEEGILPEEVYLRVRDYLVTRAQ